jgi:hypothetical protein
MNELAPGITAIWPLKPVVIDGVEFGVVARMSPCHHLSCASVLALSRLERASQIETDIKEYLESEESE